MIESDRRPRTRPVPENILDSGIWVFESDHDAAFAMTASQHSFPELLYFRAGSGRVEFTQSDRFDALHCTAGDCVIVPAHAEHYLVDDPGQPLSLFGLALDPQKIAACRELGALLPAGKLPRQRVTLLEIEQRLRRLLYLVSSQSKTASLRAVASALELLASIAQSAVDEQTARKKPDESDFPELDEYLRWLQTSFFEAVTLDEAAESCGFSRRKFTTVFKQRTGTTWLNYLHALRIEHAITLLQETQSPVTSIAFQCGFDDLSTFYRVFKRISGKQPLELRGLNE